MRIAVIGDDGVGKSSLITCLFKDKFVPNIEDLLPPLTFPLANDTLVTVVDTSPAFQKQEQLLAELRQANCIWLVFSDHYTMERISLIWLPMLRNSGVNVPVILTQNKQDQLFMDFDDENPTAHDSSVEEEEDVIQLMQDFKEIETFVRCSAKLKRNVNEAFYLCQRAIVYPLTPLFNSKQGILKPLTSEALNRIFFLCDDDQTGVLTIDEMQRLQIQVFQAPLDSDEVQLIKETLLNLHADDFEYQQPYYNQQVLWHTDEEHPGNEGITLAGFLTLSQLYCERGRHETVWAILRHFHYTDSLSLDEKFLKPLKNVNPLSRVELSPNGYEFLVDLFTLFDKDNDGGLSPQELETLFIPTPGLPPLWVQTRFPYSTLRNEFGFVTLQGWLAQWSMFVHLDYTSALSYIAMLGYLSRTDQTDLKSAVRVTKPARPRNRKSQIYRRSTVQDRQVFHCIVLGQRSSGKSTLLSSFLERPLIQYSNNSGEKTDIPPETPHNTEKPLNDINSTSRSNSSNSSSSFSDPIDPSSPNESEGIPRRHSLAVEESLLHSGIGIGSGAGGAGAETGDITLHGHHRTSSGVGSGSNASSLARQTNNNHGGTNTTKNSASNTNRSQRHTPRTATSGKGSFAVNSVEMPGGKQCYLILQELSIAEDSVEHLDKCDVVCLSYDSSDPDSFESLVELRQRHPELNDVPLVFAALKADLDRVQQRCVEQPDTYTKDLFLAAPMHVSSQWPSSLNALFVQLVESAVHPGQATVKLPGDEDEGKYVPELAIAAGIAGVVAVAWWFYRK